ncbi:MAG: CopG family transcriptional regulator [Methylococcales bacterium]
MTTLVETQIPDQLWQQAQNMVQQGWINNMDELVAEAIRRYVESHQQILSERFIQDDIEWGLHGED